jgi:single-strand DNA-binding protein
LAEVAQRYLHKGDLVYVEGKLRSRSWEKEGVTRYITEVVGDNMTMLSSKPGGGGYSSGGDMGSSSSSPERSTSESFRAPVDNSTDDLPF